jgi:hypothetical protein
MRSIPYIVSNHKKGGADSVSKIGQNWCTLCGVDGMSRHAVRNVSGHAVCEGIGKRANIGLISAARSSNKWRETLGSVC